MSDYAVVVQISELRGRSAREAQQVVAAGTHGVVLGDEPGLQDICTALGVCLSEYGESEVLRIGAGEDVSLHALVGLAHVLSESGLWVAALPHVALAGGGVSYEVDVLLRW